MEVVCIVFEMVGLYFRVFYIYLYLVVCFLNIDTWYIVSIKRNSNYNMFNISLVNQLLEWFV